MEAGASVGLCTSHMTERPYGVCEASQGTEAYSGPDSYLEVITLWAGRHTIGSLNESIFNVPRSGRFHAFVGLGRDFAKSDQ